MEQRFINKLNFLYVNFEMLILLGLVLLCIIIPSTLLFATNENFMTGKDSNLSAYLYVLIVLLLLVIFLLFISIIKQKAINRNFNNFKEESSDISIQNQSLINQNSELDQLIASQNIAIMNAKEELANLLEKEIKQSEQKTKFANMISHEFRTPLTVIFANVGLVQAFLNSPNAIDKLKIQKNVNSIEKSAIQMKNLLLAIDNLVEVQSGLIDVNLEHIDVAHYFLEAFYQYSRFYKLNENRLFIDNNNEFKNAKVSLYCINCISSELVKNIVDYSEPGSPINISIKNVNRFCQIRIITRGNPIPKGDLERIFDLFQRGSANENLGESRGLGIGLFVVRLCMDTMNGLVWAESKNTNENHFVLQFPLIDVLEED